MCKESQGDIMADERPGIAGSGTGDIPATVVSFNRSRTISPPRSETSAESETAMDMATPVLEPPEARPMSLVVIVGAVVSALWVAVAVTLAVMAGADGLHPLLATPLSLAGTVAAAITPLVVLWLVVAVFDRKTALTHEMGVVRQHLAQLAYPAAASEGRISTIADSLRAQTVSLTTATRDAAQQGQELRLVLAKETADLARVSDEARSGLTTLLGGVAEHTTRLQSLIDDMARLTADSDATLGGRIAGLNRAATASTDGAESLGRELDKQNLALTALTATLAERTSGVDSLLRRQEASSESMRAAASALSDAVEVLSVRAEATSDTLAGRAAYLVEADHRLDETASRLASALRTVLDLMGESGREADRRASALEERTRQLSEAARTASRDITAATSTANADFTALRDGAREALEGAKAVTQALSDGQHQAEAMDQSLRGGLDSLKDVGQSLAQQRSLALEAISDIQSGLTTTTERAAERLRHMQDLFGRNAVEVTRASARATVEIETVSEALKNGLGRVETITQEAREASLAVSANSDKVVGRLQSSALALLASVEQLHKMGTALGGQSEKVVESAAVAIANVSTLTQQLREEGEIFASLTATATDNADALRSIFSTVVREIDDSAALASHRMQLAAEVFEHTSDHAVTLFADTSDAFENKIKALRQTAEQTSLVIGALISDFDQQRDSNSPVGDSLRGLIEALEAQTNTLIAASRQSLTRLPAYDSEGDEPGDGGMMVSGPPRDIADIQRFLTQISYIFEKLQAAAVDLSRLFTPAVEEELWKRFYKGEPNVFLRHAAKTITRAQAEAVRGLYQNNSEFREYVTRYMGEFDALMKVTRNNERAEVLTAIFTSSDMGRLYMVIARALNREAIEPTP